MSQAGKVQELEEQFFPTSAALLQRWFPWIRLLRGFRIAIDFRRMTVALLAVFLWAAGDWLISQQAFAPINRVGDPPAVIWPWNSASIEDALMIQHLPEGFREAKIASLVQEQRIWLIRSLAAPFLRVVTPPSILLFGPPEQRNLPYMLALFLWGTVISAIFGGAIARMAAVDFARGEEISIRSALKFSSRRLLSSLGAPLIAACGFAACWGFNAMAGFLGSTPYLGELLAGLFWFVFLFLGFVMVLMLIAIGFGWPLMVTAVSTESADAFEGLSRSSSYLLNRPLYAIFLICCLVIYGTILSFFVSKMVVLTNTMAQRSFSSGHIQEDFPPARGARQTFGPLDDLTGGLASRADFHGPAQTMKSFWLRILFSIPAAFQFSYFWTMMTIIYFLLRKREDATPLNEVWMPPVTDSGKVPLVGIPAAEQREQQKQTETTGTDTPPEPQS